MSSELASRSAGVAAGATLTRSVAPESWCTALFQWCTGSMAVQTQSSLPTAGATLRPESPTPCHPTPQVSPEGRPMNGLLGRDTMQSTREQGRTQSAVTLAVPSMVVWYRSSTRNVDRSTAYLKRVVQRLGDRAAPFRQGTVALSKPST